MADDDDDAEDEEDEEEEGRVLVSDEQGLDESDAALLPPRV